MKNKNIGKQELGFILMKMFQYYFYHRNAIRKLVRKVPIFENNRINQRINNY